MSTCLKCLTPIADTEVLCWECKKDYWVDENKNLWKNTDFDDCLDMIGGTNTQNDWLSGLIHMAGW